MVRACICPSESTSRSVITSYSIHYTKLYEFPEKTNVEFVEDLGHGRLRMRVWERGVGITQACGSGACATLVAAARRGITGREGTVVLDGGELDIAWAENGHVLMTGSATLAYEGTLGELETGK